MNFISHPLALPNGEIADTHFLRTFAIDLQTYILQITVDSWIAYPEKEPLQSRDYSVQLQDWQPEYADQLKDFLLTLPEWALPAVAFTPEQVLAYQNQPTKNHVWDPVDRTWIDTRPLAALKIDKNQEINEARLAANYTSFTYAGKQIAVDALSRSDIDGVHGQVVFSNAMPVPWAGGWKAMDNTYVPIPDVVTWGEFYSAMISQGTTNFEYSQLLKAQLAAATTAQEVDAIKW